MIHDYLYKQHLKKIVCRVKKRYSNPSFLDSVQNLTLGF